MVESNNYVPSATCHVLLMINHAIIALGKALSHLSLTLNLGSGSTWPGHIALKTNKNFIKHLLKNSKTKVILVGGTNGKTTTSSLIAHILKINGNTVIQNTSGANMLNGIASTLLLHTNTKGKLDAEYAIFEVDENSLPPLLHELTPDSIILLNLFRDQLDRYGEVNSIITKWNKALSKLPKTTKLFLNADDPEIAYLGICHPERSEGSHKDSSAKPQNDNIYYFGISDTSLGQKTFQHASDSIYCPKCHAKLSYTTRFFSHIGIWKCDKCGLKRPNLSLDKAPSYPLSGIYNIYNIIAATLFAKENNISNKTIQQSFQDFKPAFGRQEIVTYYSKNVQLFLSKNPTSFNESLRTIKKLGGKYLLLVLNDRIPDGRDISWIWDTAMEEYLTPDMHIFISGDRCYDLGLRLKYADLKNVEIEPHLQKALDNFVPMTPKEETFFILPTYSAMLEARKILTGKSIL